MLWLLVAATFVPLRGTWSSPLLRLPSSSFCGTESASTWRHLPRKLRGGVLKSATLTPQLPSRCVAARCTVFAPILHRSCTVSVFHDGVLAKHCYVDVQQCSRCASVDHLFFHV